MTKENYLFQGTREKAVREAQNLVDQYVPGKVRVYCEWVEEANAWYMIGAYQSYVGYAGTVSGVTMEKREKMDRYYDVSVFTHFFKQRTAYMNALPEQQVAFEGHPATYGMVTDSFAKVI